MHVHKVKKKKKIWLKILSFPIGLSQREACQSMAATLTGFLLMAPPTARAALGFPAISARRLYETVSPNFTSFRSTCNTRLLNASSPQRTERKSERQTERTEEEGVPRLIRQLPERLPTTRQHFSTTTIWLLWNKMAIWMSIKTLRHHSWSTSWFFIMSECRFEAQVFLQGAL